MVYAPSTSTTVQFTVPGTPPTHRILTISSVTGGTTSPATGTYTHNNNDQVTITATPLLGYIFNGWTVNGASPDLTNPFVFNIIADTTVTPIFVKSGGGINPWLLVAAVAAVVIPTTYYATKKKKGENK